MQQRHCIATGRDANRRMHGAVRSVLFASSFAIVATASATAANLTPATARAIVPDGTSVFQSIGAGETRWFAFEVEAGREYVIEVVDSNGDLTANAVGNIGIWDSTGANAPPDTFVDCSLGLRDQPPGLSPTNNGKRCTVYVNAPDTASDPNNAFNRRGIWISIDQGAGSGVNLRVRDATMFGRWTTNGYDFHIELDNTTSDQVCAQALLYRESGYQYSGGTWGDALGNLSAYNMIIPPGGSVKTVVPSGTLVGGANRGTLRVMGCPGDGWQYVPGAVHVSTYAFNPVTHVYLFFYNWQSHNGDGANSW